MINLSKNKNDSIKGSLSFHSKDPLPKDGDYKKVYEACEKKIWARVAEWVEKELGIDVSNRQRSAYGSFEKDYMDDLNKLSDKIINYFFESEEACKTDLAVRERKVQSFLDAHQDVAAATKGLKKLEKEAEAMKEDALFKEFDDIGMIDVDSTDEGNDSE